MPGELASTISLARGRSVSRHNMSLWPKPQRLYYASDSRRQPVAVLSAPLFPRVHLSIFIYILCAGERKSRKLTGAQRVITRTNKYISARKNALMRRIYYTTY